jgi:hypothetical protein
MSSEYDLIRVMMQIARDDTGPGGLVSLTGQTVPMVQFFQIGSVSLPRATVFVVVSRLARGTPRTLNTDLQLDTWVEHGTEGLQWEMLDRLESILSTPNFKTYGLDVSLDIISRFAFNTEQEGRKRAVMNVACRMKR